MPIYIVAQTTIQKIVRSAHIVAASPTRAAQLAQSNFENNTLPDIHEEYIETLYAADWKVCNPPVRKQED